MHCPRRGFLTRRFSNPILRSRAVEMMRSHQGIDSFFDQTSRCFQNQVILLASFDVLLCFLFCLVPADCHASDLTDFELVAVMRYTVSVGHVVPSKREYKAFGGGKS